VSNIEGKYKVTASFEQTGNDIVFGNTLNNELVRIMRSFGFDVTLGEHSLFDPRNAQFTANGLLAVIRIAQGQAGIDALPEEFSHWFISGTKNSPLTRRLIASITDEVARYVLGDRYEDYYEAYGGDQLRINEEVAG